VGIREANRPTHLHTGDALCQQAQIPRPYTEGMHLPLAFELPAFLIGLLFGSFLNVCISRLPLHESIVKPRSRCPRCFHTIRWYDNIPLLSWIALRARCRDCRATIPWRYPLVELALGIWFAVVAHQLVTLLNFLANAAVQSDVRTEMWASGLTFIVATAVLGFLLIGLLVMDWQTNTLPDAFTVPGIGIGLFLVCVQALFLAPDEAAIHLDAAHSLRMSSPGSFVERGNVFLTGPEHLIFGRVAAVMGAALIPFLIRWLYKLVRGRQGMGFGDVKLMAMIAAFLGFWPAIVAFFVGCVLIFPYAIALLIRKRADRATPLPFGSFLAAGGLVAALMGPALIDWYRSLL
jgi:leader peptidase (prepilin peptidase)/N-methyltransferase